jgi:hypothetical protein
MVLAEESIAERHGCMIELAWTFPFSGRFSTRIPAAFRFSDAFIIGNSASCVTPTPPDRASGYASKAALLAGRLVLSVSAKVVGAWDVDPVQSYGWRRRGVGLDWMEIPAPAKGFVHIRSQFL